MLYNNNNNNNNNNSNNNEKHNKLASDIIDLNLIKENASEKLDNNVESAILGTDYFDKISVSANENKNIKQGLDNNAKTSMEWTTVRPRGIVRWLRSKF